MDQKDKPSKTLPYTLIAASAVMALITISGFVSSGKFSIGPLGVFLFAATAVVVWKTWFKTGVE